MGVLLSTIKSKRRISIDIIYTILSSFLVTGAMQLIVYPLLAWKYSSVEYGEILAVMGITNTLVGTFGGSLNNIRLMLDTEYKEEEVNGDFLPLLSVSIVAELVVVIPLLLFVFRRSLFEVILLLLFIAMGTINSYLCVYFRLILDFKKILIQKVFGVVGLMMGLVFIGLTSIWVLPFIVSETLQLIMLIKETGFYVGTFNLTPKIYKTTYKLLVLMATALSGNLINYLDRLILLPLMGGEGVSIYSVASFFGKGLGIVITPIAGVLLGYYAQKDYVMNRMKFWKTNTIMIVGGVLFTLIAIIVSPYITSLLYPKVFSDAKQYIFIANLSSTIYIMSILTQSAVLKFAPIWIQIVKEFVYGITYICMGKALFDLYGLRGFCCAAVSANAFRLIMLYVFGTVYIKSKKQ